MTGAHNTRKTATIASPDEGNGTVVAPEKGPRTVPIVAATALRVLVVATILWWVRRRTSVDP